MTEFKAQVFLEKKEKAIKLRSEIKDLGLSKMLTILNQKICEIIFLLYFG